MNPTKPTHIDATGLICPMPLLKLKQAMSGVSAKEVLEISVTDPHAELDFEIWCERFGHQLTLVHAKPNLWVFRVVCQGTGSP